MNTDTILILAGIGGVLAHCLMKMDSLSKDAAVANVNFDWKKDYLYKDKFGIILSFLSVALWYLIFGEAAAKYPKLEGWAITSFVVMGLTGSYLIQLVSSRAKKRIRSIVDAKTNIADDKTDKP